MDPDSVRLFLEMLPVAGREGEVNRDSFEK
jgi:hypothetical protein